MGDVAMTVPVIHALATQHPDLRITVLTRKHLADLFSWTPSNVEVMGVNLDDYKGIGGLERLYSQLRQRRFDTVADLHDVLRTKYLRTRFRMSGRQVAVIDKGRKQKQALIGHGTDAANLPHMTERYADVFRHLQLSVSLDFQRAFDPRLEDFTPIENRVGRKTGRWIGIAPFAAHEGKIYPLHLMQQVAVTLASRGYHVFLFGAGNKERQILQAWEQEGIRSVCGQMGGLRNEMLLMSRLDAMVAMDSANMHMAALVGTPVVSVWGSTHPKAGFTPWGQPATNIVQTDTLTCRPCSVYGNQPCQFGDYRCLSHIRPETIVQAVESCINQ